MKTKIRATTKTNIILIFFARCSRRGVRWEHDSGASGGGEDESAGERAKQAAVELCLEEDEHTRDESREMATDGYIHC